MIFKQLKTQVLNTLRDFPETRNSDITLTIQIWKTYYPKMVFTVKEVTTISGVGGSNPRTQEKQTEVVRLTDLFELPREDNVKRIRAKIQNEEGKYVPTEWAIAEKRGFKEQEWRQHLGYLNI